MEENKLADQAAKHAAVKPIEPSFEGLSLAQVRRAYTEARSKAIQEWAHENVVQRTHQQGRAYRMLRG